MNSNSDGRGSASRIAVVPAIVVALLPTLSCPACWPAYAGLLSSFGIGFFNYTSYLLPTTSVFLAVAVAALIYRAKARRGYGPFVLGLLASIMILAGKFSYDSDTALYLGVGILIGASLWNTRPRRLKHGIAN